MLAKFAPPAIPPAVSGRIQALLDVRSPGVGLVSPDGKRLFFSWTVTGTRQVWRLDGPQRFPVQLTGGEDRTIPEGISSDGSFLLVSRDHGGSEYPVGEAVQMHDALDARGIKSPLIIFPDEGHGAGKRANQVVQFGASLDFFEQTLKPKGDGRAER